MEFCYNFCSETTIHGLCHIAKDKPLRFRLLWLVIFLMGLSATGVWYYNTIELFLQKPTSTEFKIIKKDSFYLPRVMICATNPFNGTKVQELNISKDLISVFHRDLMPVLSWSVIPEQLDYETLLNQTYAEYNDLQQKLNASHHHEILDHLYPKCEDIVLECKTKLGALAACCSQAVMYEIFKTPCVLMPQYKLFVSELNPGIMFLLKYPNVSELTPSGTSAFITAHQVLLLKHDNMLEMDAGGGAARGKYTEISIEKIQHTSVSKPPEFECVDRENYSQVACNLNCRTKHTFQNMSSHIQSIGCAVKSLIGRKLGDKAPTCDPWQNYQYYKILYTQDSAAELESMVAECAKQCLPPCKLVRYNFRYLHINDFSEDALHKLWNDPSRTRDILETRGFLAVSSKPETEVIHQQFSMTPTMLIGTLGGSLGLFLGGSLASVVHVIIYIIQRVFGKKKEKRKKKKEKKKKKEETTGTGRY